MSGPFVSLSVALQNFCLLQQKYFGNLQKNLALPSFSSCQRVLFNCQRHAQENVFALTMFIICKNQLKDIPDLTYFHIFFKSCVSYMVGILEYQGLERVWYFSRSVLKNQVTKWDQIKGRPPQLLTGQHFFVFLLLLIEVELLLEKFLQTDLYEKLIKCSTYHFSWPGKYFGPGWWCQIM